MRRNCHYRARAVACKNEIADEHSDFFIIDRVDAGNSLELTARLSLVELGSVHIVLLESLCDICLDLFLVLNLRHQLLYDLSVGSEHHKGNTVDSLDTSSEYRELTAADDLEFYFHTRRLADPVLLHKFRGLGPIDLLKSLEKLLGKRGLIDNPLFHILSDYGEAASLGLTVDDLVVGEHSAELLAPVYRHIDVLCIAVEIELLEYPLSPLVELGIARRDHLAPVVVKAKLLELSRECLYVLLRKSVGVVARVYRILLGGKTEGVVAHRVKDVVALHSLHSRDYVRSGISLGVTCVKSDTRRIREHIKHVILRL